MLDGERAYLVAPPGGRSHGESLSQRLMWQPFWRPKVAQTDLPAIVPTMRARCGPPQISVHTAPAGTGATSFAPPAASRAHAREGRGSVPRAGLHPSVQTSSGWAVSTPRSQKLMRSDVPVDGPA